MGYESIYSPMNDVVSRDHTIEHVHMMYREIMNIIMFVVAIGNCNSPRCTWKDDRPMAT